MGSVWIDIPTSEVDEESWIHIKRLTIDITSKIFTKIEFDKITINISIPERALDIRSKVENIFISSEPGIVGNVFLKRFDYSLPIIHPIFKNYDFCDAIDKLYSGDILSIYAASDPQNSQTIIDFYLNCTYKAIYESSRRYSKNRKSMQNYIRILLANLFPDQVSIDLDENRIKDFIMNEIKENSFFSKFKNSQIQFEPYIADEIMIVKLFPYQIRNISWMISRENSINTPKNFVFNFFKIENSKNIPLYFNNFTGFLSDSPLKIQVKLPRGGVLADEMGLGKTLEVLALILLNPVNLEQKSKSIKTNHCFRCHKIVNKKIYDVYKNLFLKNLPGNLLCSNCLGKKDVYKSRSTLIVCPASLMEQWTAEITTKIRSNISIAIYEGVRKKYIHPISLIDYDIILTSYNVLQAEFYHSEIFKSNEEKIFRKKRKYESKPSPLSFVEFWRAIFDESQVAECKNAKMSQMCCYIKSVNRWCVTGTPIHRSLDDIEGIFSLIKYTPFDDKKLFKEIFYHDLSIGKLDNLITILQDVMHRTEKVEADTEVHIPSVTEKTILVELDPIELHYYLDYQTRNSLKTDKWNKHIKYRNPDQKIESKAQKTLISQFMTLRKLCCDPFHILPKKTTLAEMESTYDMQEAIEKLIEKKKLDCEEINRSLFMFRNGLAGLSFLKGDKINAASIYKYTIDMYCSNREYFDADRLQKIHILRNYTALQTQPDPFLKCQLMEAISKYLESSMNDITSSRKPLSKIISDISTINEDDNLFMKLKDEIKKHNNYSNALTHKISMAIKKEGLTNSIFSKPFQLSIIEKYVISVLEKNKNLLNESIEYIGELETSNRKQILNAARLCCIGENKPKTCIFENGKYNFNMNCPFCKIDSILHDLELSLFDQSVQKIHETGLVAGFRGNTDIDVILKVLFPVSDYRVSECPIRLWLIYVKKCFSALRSHFSHVRNWFTAQDEIETCCRRLKLSDIKNSAHLDESELIERTEIEYKIESESLKKKLEIEISQLRYFINLSKSCSTKTSFNDEKCPICYDELGKQWIVLVCSHFICNICFKKSLKTLENTNFSCPMCRLTSPSDEVFYINTNKAQESNEERTEFSSKIAKIAAYVQEILSDSDCEKIILFSNWDSVLSLCKMCFIKNNLNCCFAISVNHLSNELEKFNQDSNIRILLMNIRLGSKGITITSANHVIFADVCLNRQDELQAIGRCHRIGQLRPITVCYFVTKNTIEEKIYKNREITERLLSSKSRKKFTHNEVQEFLKFNEEKHLNIS